MLPSHPPNTTDLLSGDTASTHKASTEAPRPSLRRENTMLATSKEGQALIEEALLDSSRSGTRNVQQALDASRTPTPTLSRQKRPPIRNGKVSKLVARPKRESTMTATIKEARALLGTGGLIHGASRAPRSVNLPAHVYKKKLSFPAKPKREDTMRKTAREGREFLNRL